MYAIRSYYEMGAQVAGIILRTMDEAGLAPTHEWQAHDIKPRGRHHPAVMAQLSLVVESYNFV